MSVGKLYRHLFLAELFRRADVEGYGIANGASFEAIPGLEDAAADFMESITGTVMDDVESVLYDLPRTRAQANRGDAS